MNERNENDMTDYQCGMVDGRNQCIDEITGEVKQMERLTKRYVDDFGQKAITACGETYFEGEDGYVVVDRLASYEDLEEQGLFVRLPCKVGTEVYYILGIPNKTPCTIDKCVFKLSDIDKIGESLFLTCKEAEKKLEEMKK